MKTKSNAEKAQTVDLDRIQDLEDQIDQLQKDHEKILARIKKREEEEPIETEEGEQADHSGKFAGETEHQFLVRTGKITPFATSDSINTVIERPQNFTAQRLAAPGFDVPEGLTDISVPASDEDTSVSKEEPARKRRRLVKKADSDDSGTDYAPSDASSDEYATSDEYASDDEFVVKSKRSKKRKVGEITDDYTHDEEEEVQVVDDGDTSTWKTRASKWSAQRRAARAKAQAYPQGSYEEHKLETRNPHPTVADLEFDGGYKLPGDIHPALFEYQLNGVKWFWELHKKDCGGILADEMGLGKTIQTVAFLAGLQHSGMLSKPALIVAPATILKQWVAEFQQWWPAMRVVILHSTGSGIKDKSSDENGQSNRGKELTDEVFRTGHIICTTYQGLTQGYEFLLSRDWSYVVLDEGHKIKNPDINLTLACKSLRTSHRLMLTGTPIQNNMVELWSVFDFVYPGLLGTLPTFKAEFETPIKLGSYKGANESEIQKAYQVTKALQEVYGPYMLRRLKTDVATTLPKKEETVLFCDITNEQRQAYLDYQKSGEFKSVLDEKLNRFTAIDVFRKICNHPDLTQRVKNQNKEDYGNYIRSGKMVILKGLIENNLRDGHRMLVFTQTRQMLDILEKFVKKELNHIKYFRLDGSCSIATRDPLVRRFNSDESIQLFLLTTAVGGLGLNLTGADRVVIYDPDWNPSTDAQARERSYRLGQKRDVKIYRMMTAGTIEEKIYHRQIFKNWLADKVIKDPSTRTTDFTPGELQELFKLEDYDPDAAAAGAVIKDHSSEIPKEVVGEEIYIEDEDSDKEDGDNIMGQFFGSDMARQAEAQLERFKAKGMTIAAKKAENEAKRAIARLKESASLIRGKKEDYQPTWTGRSGKGGIEEHRERDLKRLPKKEVKYSIKETPAQLKTAIRSWIRQNLRADKGQLSEKFLARCKASGITNFERLVESVAVQRDGVWVLKDLQGNLPQNLAVEGLSEMQKRMFANMRGGGGVYRVQKNPQNSSRAPVRK